MIVGVGRWWIYLGVSCFFGMWVGLDFKWYKATHTLDSNGWKTDIECED